MRPRPRGLHSDPESGEDRSGAERIWTFQYDGPHSAEAPDDVSTSIPADKVTAIVGASGSGKTTMLKMMPGFYSPAEGEVLLGGRKIRNVARRAGAGPAAR